MKRRKRNSVVLRALEALQMGSAGNTRLPTAVTDEAAQSTGMRGKSQKQEKWERN